MNGVQAMRELMAETNDWMIGGNRDPQANRAYGFREAMAGQAAVSAYVQAFAQVGDSDRAALHRAFFECFRGEIAELLER